MASRLLRIANPLRQLSLRCMSDSQQPGWGSGAGKGGGSGGSVRSAGGAFGQMEAAQEEQYFRKLQQEQLANLKELQKHLNDEIGYHEKEIKEHEQDLKRHKEKLAQLKNLHGEDEH